MKYASFCKSPAIGLIVASFLAVLLLQPDSAHALPSCAEIGNNLHLINTGFSTTATHKTLRLHGGSVIKDGPSVIKDRPFSLLRGRDKRSHSSKKRLADKTFLQKNLLLFKVVLWYSLNVSWNLKNKQLCSLLDLPLTACALQMATGVLFMMCTWLLKLRKMPGAWEWKNTQLQALGAVHALGQASTIAAFSSGSVSFVSVIKALEPLFAAGIGVYFLNERLPAVVVASIVPVCVGIAMASFGEVAFRWPCFLLAQLSNVCYAGRAVWFKKVFDDSESAHTQELELQQAQLVRPTLTQRLLLAAPSGRALVEDRRIGAYVAFPVVSVIGTLMLVVASVVVEGRGSALSVYTQAMANVNKAGLSSYDAMLLVLLVGFLQYTNDEMSFVVLEDLSAVSQSVANTFKRGFTIVAAAYYFKTPMKLLGVAGGAVAITGMVLYSVISERHRKNMAQAKKEEEAEALSKKQRARA